MHRLETKILDPADGFGTLADVVEVTDPTLARRGNRWWLYGASQVVGRPGIQLVSASLPAGAPLSPTGWTLTPDSGDARKIATLAGYDASHAWDLQGGRICVYPTPNGYGAVFSRVWVRDPPAPPATGLWWCTAPNPSGNLDDWSRPVQIMTADDRGWHAGPWKPSGRPSDTDPDRRLVFFSGSYSRNDGSPFPFVFTLGCVEIERPQGDAM